MVDHAGVQASDVFVDVRSREGRAAELVAIASLCQLGLAGCGE